MKDGKAQTDPRHIPESDRGESWLIILTILIGWTGFSFADITSKYLTQDYAPSLILAIHAALALIILSVWIYLDRGFSGFKTPKWKLHVLRGVINAFVAIGIVNALSYLPVANVYGITFSSPFLIAIMSFLFLKEHVALFKWIVIAVGFAGVLILLGPEFGQMNIGYAYAVLCVVCIAVSTILIRIIGKAEYFPIFLIYPYIAVLAFNLPFALEEFSNINWRDSWLFLLNSLFVFVGQLGTTYAFSKANSAAGLAPFVYVQIVWGVLLGFLVFGNIPVMTTWIGLVLVVGAGLYMIYRDRRDTGILARKIR
jgi:S-adenosylmethionine uptake transporter